MHCYNNFFYYVRFAVYTKVTEAGFIIIIFTQLIKPCVVYIARMWVNRHAKDVDLLFAVC